MIADAYLQSRAELGTALATLSSLAQDLRAPAQTLETLQSLQQSLREPFLFVVAGEVKGQIVAAQRALRTRLLPR
jgi:hypothetical protein